MGLKINVLEYLEKTAKSNPSKTAVVDGERTISFSVLAARSKSLATSINRQHNILSKPIGVFLPKSIESVVANLAITYSGNIYMNLDIKNPAQRIKNIVEKIQPALLISNTEFMPVLKSIGIPESALLNIDDYTDDKNFNNTELFKRLEALIDTDPYCIINTSGSTGTPKGVVLNHRSFVDFTEWAIDTLKINDNEIIGSLSPLYFDI